MHRLLRFIRRLFNVVHPHRRDDDIAREISAHVTLLEDEYRRRGLSPEEAHRRAHVALGGVERIKELHRDARSFAVADDFIRDIQIGARMMRRQWGTSLVLALTVALGIGANTAVFSLIETVFLRALPVHDPYRLVLFSGDPGGGTRTTNTPPDGVWDLFSSEAADFLRDSASVFESVAAFAATDDTVTARRPTERGPGAREDAHLVSGNYFSVLGVEPELGRVFTAADDRLEAAPVAIVSDGFWRNALRGDPEVVGSILMVNKTAVTVIGVMPPEFFGVRVRRAPDLWIPLARQPEVQLREPFRLRDDYYWLNLIGRLAPGRTAVSAQTSMTDALHRFLTMKAGSSSDATVLTRIRGTRLAMVSGARGLSFVRDRDVKPLGLLLTVVGLLLLLACANVATLLLCRANGRRTEVAVRRALGAGRGRLVRQWLTESLMLGATGAIGGLLLARWIAPILDTFFPSGPVHATLNSTVLAFATGASFVATLLFGLAPTLYAGRVSELGALRSTGHGTDARRRTMGVAEPLVIAQIAVSLVLVVGATLFARTLFNLEREPLGFDQDNVLLVPINPRLAGYTPANVGGLYRRLYDQVSTLPGVEAATFARYSPFSGHTSSFGASVEGYAPPDATRLRLETVQVGPNYPQTLGMPLVTGRAISIDDTVGTTMVAMVNETFVHQFFPAAAPIGHHLRLGDRSYEIVGVVRDAIFHSPRDRMVPFVFVSMLQVTDQMVLDCELELRTRNNAAGIAPLVRQTVNQLDSRLGVTRTLTLRAQVLDTFGSERVMAGFVMVLAGLGLIVAAVGLYGVVSHTVVRRTKEIGVRISLGASRKDVLSLIAREIGTQIVIGLAVGAAVAASGGRAVASQLFGLGARDLTSFLIASGILALVAMLASLVPAVRAVRIHPSVSLRFE
jgi:predicted permease